MKIRTGFVSNSSSSSFILMFQALPKSWKELEKILFGEYDSDHTCVAYYDHMISKVKAAQIIFNDIMNEAKEENKKNQEEEIKKDFHSQLYSLVSYDTYSNHHRRDEVEKHELFNNLEDIKKARELSKLDSDANEEFCDYYNSVRENKDVHQDPKYLKLLGERNNITEGYYKLLDKIVDEAYSLFMETNKDKKIIRLEYSDNEGEIGSVLEHGEILEGLESIKTIKTSHH